MNRHFHAIFALKLTCLKNSNDVSVSPSFSLNVLARLVAWHRCLGKCLCLGKMSRLNHWYAAL